ncbi:hypothetical protein ES703_121556 [subsurface metagenome]
MPVYDRFKTTRTARFPAAYLIPATFREAVELLRRHGIIVERLLADWKGTTEAFVIDEIVSAERPFQGHILKELKGHFESAQTEVTKGSYLVKTAQPLGILIFHLLEPESLDGVAAWGFLDSELWLNKPYPIRKCYERIHTSSERLH